MTIREYTVNGLCEGELFLQDKGFYVNASIAYGTKTTDYFINKKAFDAVILYKDAIENSLGVKLIWNRGDDIKSSKISYQINDVSIENETDWFQMAKFHAHWSKKFYDVIVPYLR